MYDSSNLKKLPALKALAPEAMAGFEALDRAALAVALTTQCPYCLDVHRAAAVKAGATEAELAETVFVAAALRAGAAVTHGTHLLPAQET